jgi:hypothetical protein
MRLRDVELGDLGAYVRMRCDPVMMAELGGPLPREGVGEKVARDAGYRDRLDGPAGVPGTGLAKRAVRMLLDLARDDGRWGPPT